MCGISGAICAGKGFTQDFYILKRILKESSNRGKDSFGVSFLSEGTWIHHKFVDSSKNVLENEIIKFPKLIKVMMANTRAEPTTEYVKHKSQLDVQPYIGESNIVIHNGTIANDKELKEEYDLKPITPIDSAIIPLLLDKIWDGRSSEDLAKLLSVKLVGSYALGIWNKKSPNSIWLATNYKPLYICGDRKRNAVYFASLPEYLPASQMFTSVISNFIVREVKPYTLLQITWSDGILFMSNRSLWKQDTSNLFARKKRALIICSGGMDSTVCASWAKSQGYDITLLHFMYDCIAQVKEHKAVCDIVRYLECEYVTIPIDFFKKTIKHSRLTNPDEDGALVKDGDGIASAELAWEYVPARNLIFMSIAAAYAEAHGFDYIILGGNLEESGAYPDNEIIFQRKFNEILPNALDLQHKVEVLTPVGNLMKHEIVKLGLELKAPLHLTWSCYEGDTYHCGKCGPCLMRRVGFKMSGVKDMIPYEWVPDGFWDDTLSQSTVDGKISKLESK